MPKKEESMEVTRVEGSYSLLGWTSELPLLLRGTGKEQGRVHPIMKQVLENQQRLWEIQVHLQDYLMRVAKQQQYCKKKVGEVISTRNRRGVPGLGGQRPS